MAFLNLAEALEQVDHSPEFVDLSYDNDTQNMAIVLHDGLDGAAYIINKDGVVVKADQCGFNSWVAIPDAIEYLAAFIRFADEDFPIALEKFKEGLY